MTREQQKQIKAQKLAAKQAAREEKKQDKQDLKNWNKMIERARAKGALIED